MESKRRVQNGAVRQKQARLKGGRRLYDPSLSDSLIQNKVHELIAYIETHYKREDDIEKDFANAALTGALGLLDEILGKEEIAPEIKRGLFAQIARAATEKAEKLAPAPHKPKVFWSERGRDRRFMSPCDWVKENWPTYGKGLALSDIRDVDRPLYYALVYYKRQYGWPSDFKLPTKKERNDELLEQLGGRVDMSRLEDLPSDVRRKKRALLSAQHRRAARGSHAP